VARIEVRSRPHVAFRAPAAGGPRDWDSRGTSKPLKKTPSYGGCEVKREVERPYRNGPIPLQAVSGPGRRMIPGLDRVRDQASIMLSHGAAKLPTLASTPVGGLRPRARLGLARPRPPPFRPGRRQPRPPPPPFGLGVPPPSGLGLGHRVAEKKIPGNFPGKILSGSFACGEAV
jgi:hypothetical protein